MGDLIIGIVCVAMGVLLITAGIRGMRKQRRDE